MAYQKFLVGILFRAHQNGAQKGDRGTMNRKSQREVIWPFVVAALLFGLGAILLGIAWMINNPA